MVPYERSISSKRDPDELYISSLRAIQKLGEFQITSGNEFERLIRARRLIAFEHDNFMEIEIRHREKSSLCIRILDAFTNYLPESWFVDICPGLFFRLIDEHREGIEKLTAGWYEYTTIGKYMHAILGQYTEERLPI